MAAGEAFNIGRVIRRTFGLISRNWAPFSVLGALFSGLPYLLILVALPATLSAAANAGAFLLPFTSFGLGAVYLLAAMVLQAALTRASIDELSGGRISLSAAFRAGFAALLPMLGLALLMVFFAVVAVFGIGLVGGMAALGAGYGLIVVVALALVVSAVYLFVRWIAVVPVVVVERPGAIQSLRRSSALTEGHRWAILGIVVLYVVALSVLQAVLDALLPAVELQLIGSPLSAGVIASACVLFVVQIATSVVVAVGIAAIYFELRQIKEGVGVEELAQVFA